MMQQFPSYRESHAALGYGKHYSRTYETGYYADLWRKIERPLLERILSRLAGDRGRTCLDFACGTGRITAVAEHHFASCTGVDVSEEMLAVARERCRNSTLRRIDITKEPLSQRFDVITAFRFFLNAEPDLRQAALRAIEDHLAPGGKLVINVHVNRTSVLGRVYELRNSLKGRVVANTLGLEDISAVLAANGFVVEQVHWYGFYPRTGWRLQWLARLLMSPTEWAFRRATFIPRRLAQSFILVCGHRPRDASAAALRGSAG